MDFDWKDFDAQLKRRAVTEDCPIPQGFDARLETQLNELPAKVRSKKRLGRRVIAVMAAVLILTGSALAISSTLREQLSQALGLFEAYTTPIEGTSAVDQGIKIQILSAMADEYSVRIYLEAQDLTEKRPMGDISSLWIDFLTPLEGSEIQGMSFGTKLLCYEEETHTVLVELSASGEDYSQMRNWNLAISRITFSNRYEQEDITGDWQLPFTLTPLETRTVSLDGGDHSDFHTLKISPIGMILEGGADSFLQFTDAEIIFADGHAESVKRGAGQGKTDQITSSWEFSEPVSPEEIVRVELPSWTITLNSTEQGSVTRK